MFPKKSEAFGSFDTFPNFSKIFPRQTEEESKDLSPIDLANIDIESFDNEEQPRYISTLDKLFYGQAGKKQAGFDEDETLKKHLLALDLHLSDIDNEFGSYKYEKPSFSLSGSMSMTPNPRSNIMSPLSKRAQSGGVQVLMPNGKPAMLIPLETKSQYPSLVPDKDPGLSEYVGQVFTLAQEQAGCRLLQQLLDTNPKVHFAPMYAEIKHEQFLISLICHPFGNYLFQKMTILAPDTTRKQMLNSTRGWLVNASLNLHGTRSVQKFIELGRSQEEMGIIASEFSRPGVITKLAMDTNGNHVVQRLLEMIPHTGRNYSFVFQHCMNDALIITKHRHGCCVYQRCLDAAKHDPALLKRLLTRIASKPVELMKDPFANYVVQYVLQFPEMRQIITKAVRNQVSDLACHKFSSNVIEKLIEYDSSLIIEIQKNVKKLLHDQYANYVLQKCLQVGPLEVVNPLVKSLKVDLPELGKFNPSCAKRITGKVLKRFPEFRRDPVFAAHM